jgi:Cu(I)/Ag(I) efflux system membrane fusion protein
MTIPTDPKAPRPAEPPHGDMPEGEEAPPPGVGTMALVRWALVALMALAAVGAWVHFARSGHGEITRAQAKYLCPMHPSVLSERPGSCPICGMDLVPIQGTAGSDATPAQAAKGGEPVGAGAKAKGAYWCPMHPEVSSDDPNAVCAKCGGMKLLPRDKPPPGSDGPGAYWCPMHPDVHSDDPTATCARCGGMKLIAREKGAPRPAVAAAPAGRYWCPMHPEVSSDDPAAICEKCGGMRLVPREQVPGLVPVDVSADRVQLIGMKTAAVTMQKLAPTIRTVGIVTVNEGRVVIVSAYASGWIEALVVSQSGERVKKGQALAKLYSPDLATAQLNFLNAIKWVRDQPNLNPTTQAPSSIEADARNRLSLLGISDPDIQEIETTRKPLRAVNIRSPTDGYVGKRTAQAGLYVSPGQELFEIADLSSVWVVADVYESDIARVKVGQRGSITLQAVPGKIFHGKVSFIYPVVSPTSRTVQVRMDFHNPDLVLRPGMFADVTFDLGAVDGLAVPSDALVETGESQYVFVALAGGRFEPRRVTVGVRTGERVQILSGVSAGERVVTTANFLIDSESRLRAAIQGFGAAAEEPAPPPARDPGGVTHPPSKPPADPHAGHDRSATRPAPDAAAGK